MKRKLARRAVTLKRELGLFATTACGVGIILGAGIYVLIGVAAKMAGPAVWISFLLAALVAGFTGLSYAELSSIFPRDASEYLYAEKAFGPRLAFIVGWLLIIGMIVSAAAVALGFAGYFKVLFGTPIILTAIVLIAILSAINFWGIKESAWFNIVFTAIEMGGLILIIALGLKYIGTINYLEMPAGFSGIFAAAALIFFAFIGFEDVVKLSEETKNPTKTIPLALILSIVITTILYVLVAISAVSILNWQVLGASAAPLADVASRALGSNAFLLLAVIALFATANTILFILVAGSRMVWGMAGLKVLPRALERIHKTRRTPWVAIAVVMAFSMAFVLIGRIETVASITNFMVFATFIIVNLALIWLRYSQPTLIRPFRSPVNIGRFPVLAGAGALTCVFMLLNFSWQILVAGLAIMLVGAGLYEWIKKQEW